MYLVPLRSENVNKPNTSKSMYLLATLGVGNIPVPALDATKLRELKASGSGAFVMYDVERCAPCEQMRVFWGMVKEKLPVPTYMVQCEREPMACQTAFRDPRTRRGEPIFEVLGLADEPLRYTGQKNPEALLVFLNDQVVALQKPSATRLLKQQIRHMEMLFQGRGLERVAEPEEEFEAPAFAMPIEEWGITPTGGNSQPDHQAVGTIGISSGTGGGIHFASFT